MLFSDVYFRGFVQCQDQQWKKEPPAMRTVLVYKGVSKYVTLNTRLGQ